MQVLIFIYPVFCKYIGPAPHPCSRWRVFRLPLALHNSANEKENRFFVSRIDRAASLSGKKTDTTLWLIVRSLRCSANVFIPVQINIDDMTVVVRTKTIRQTVFSKMQTKARTAIGNVKVRLHLLMKAALIIKNLFDLGRKCYNKRNRLSRDG
jgi:hypothetical protein